MQARTTSRLQAAAFITLALVLLVIAVPSWRAMAQSTIGVFSRIYLGSSSGPAIRYGSPAPTGACVPGSLYLQKVTGQDDGAVWVCRKSGEWHSTGSGGGALDYLVTDFGATCDGATDDRAAILLALNAIKAQTSKTGTVVIPDKTCAFTGGLPFGPVATPWGVEPTADPAILNVIVSFTPPRSATFTYGTPDVDGNVTLTFSGTDLTASDVGNEVFYGTRDAAWFAYDGRSIVTVPTYACAISSVNTGAHTAACAKLAQHNAAIGNAGTLAATAGSHASYVSNDHDFTIEDSNNLVSDNVGKTFTFAMPTIRAPLDCLGVSCSARPADAVSPLDGSVYGSPPCVGGSPADSWLCANGGNVKLKYFSATVTSRVDAKHGTMDIKGIDVGSNWIGLWSDANHGNGAYSSAEYAYLLGASTSLLASSTHIDHQIDFDIAVTYMQTGFNSGQAQQGVGHFYPYLLPFDTAIVHISLRGQGAYSSILKYLGPGTEPGNSPAVMFSRNKQFTVEKIAVVNGETCGSGSCFDTHERVGLYFGGLPGGGGTQTFFMVGSQIDVGGFNIGVLMGDSLGGETSDEAFSQLSMEWCGIGFLMAPGSYNTLDVKCFNCGGGINKIGFENWDGNLIVQNGSMSFNDIDFYSRGFGPFIISGMRSEGPGRFFYGNEASVSLRDNNIAEVQGSRTTTGTVTCTPLDVSDVTVDLGADTGGPPAATFYPLTFSADALTAADVGKTLVIELTGGNVIGYLSQATSSTTGILVRQYGTAAVESGKTARLYGNDRCAMTWAADQALPSDVGAAFMLPSGDTHSEYASLVKVYVDTVDSSTTGTGHWQLSQGGPVVHGGSSDVNPVLFDNVAIEFTNLAYNTVVDSFYAAGGMISVQSSNGSNGSLTLTNSMMATAGPVLNADALPLRFEPIGKAFHIDPTLANLPAPCGNCGHSTGLQWAGTIDDSTNSYGDGGIEIHASGNYARAYGGVASPIQDVWGRFRGGGFDAFFKMPKSVYGSEAGHNAYDNHPTDPVSPEFKLGWVKSLSGGVLSNGRNLRVICGFATSDTASCTFKRDETLIYDHLAVGKYTPGRREALLETDSGHFTIGDLGRTVCYDATSSDTGTRTVCGYVTDIVDATHIHLRAAVGTLSLLSGNNTDFTVTGHVGDDEPDANYLVFLSCTGNTTVNETFTASSLATTGFTITSSNVVSTAQCNALIIR